MLPINLPIRGAPAPRVCNCIVTEDFLNQRAKLSVEHIRAVERIVSSFDSVPESRSDFEFQRTPVGTAHVRYRDGCYVFFQRFNENRPYKFRIMLWWCGTYTSAGGNLRFDFE